jgi:hypothetical protein
MRCFEILIAESAVSTNGAPFVPDDRIMIGIPDEAEQLLDPILSVYGQDPSWFFDKINFGRQRIPWALACLDREYPIAGHIGMARGADSGIGFTSYNQPPEPLPDDFVPRVGVLGFKSKIGLENVVAKSPIFEAAWEALINCSPDKPWLAILDPLPEDWLALVVPGDSERWLASRRK